MILVDRGPRDDETLTSVFARNLSRFIPQSRRAIASKTIGSLNATLHNDLPGRMLELERTFGRNLGLTADDLIERTTMLPLLRPFMTEERTLLLLERMKNSGGGSGQFVRIRELHNRHNNLRYCPQCRRDDELNGDGVTWWRRTNQVPGVDFCPIHECRLVVSNFLCSANWKSEYVEAALALPVEEVAPRDPETGRRLRLAKDVRWLLNTPCPALGPMALRDVYVARLRDMGLAGPNEVRRRAVLEEFASWLGPQTRQMEGLQFNSTNDSAWPVQVMLGKNNYHRPVRHLYVMQFLNLPIADAVQRAADPHRKAHPLRKRATGAEIALLKSLWADSTVSLNEIARRMRRQCQTITRWATTNRLPFPRMAKGLDCYRFALRRQNCRYDWKMLWNAKDSRRKRNCERWLERNDGEWLAAHRADPKVVSGNPVVDWDARDAEYAERVPYIAARIRALHPFRRVSFSAIVENFRNRAAVRYRPELFPKTNAAIALVTETQRDFVSRRIAVIRRENPKARPHQIRQMACVAHNLTSPEILAALGYHKFRGRIVDTNT